MLRIDKYLDELEPSRIRILDALDQGRTRIWVEDDASWGGETVVSDLARTLEDSAVVVLPSADDIDAPIHGLYQLASFLNADGRQPILDDGPEKSLAKRAALAAQGLCQIDRVLILVIPASWRPPDTKDDPAGQIRTARASELLEGLLDVDTLPTVIFSSPNLSPPRSGFKRIRLSPIQLPPTVIEEPTGSGRYVDAARALHAVLQRRKLRMTPTQIRLAIAVIALGDQAEDVVGELERPERPGGTMSNPMPLATRLLARLETTEYQELRVGLRRLAQSRYPLPQNEALALAGLPDEHRSLLTDCIGSGDDTVHLTEYIRRVLLQGHAGEARCADAHDALAEYHNTRDGARDPATLSQESTLHWLEKVHHLAHGSERSRQKWREQSLRSRDFYWELAWSLSVEEHDYEAAANVYREALQQFGPDGYTCHYLAYNLDHVGKEPDVVEDMYRRAVEMDPANPWWNSRLVTFLIDQARFRAAGAEWSKALARVDPDRTRVDNGPWLASHLHRWVVKTWLDHGQVERAREAFDAIPPTVVSRDGWLSELKHRLEDAEEARSLGESVYPAGMPMSERWHGPRLIPERNHNGFARVAWYPGRVVEATEDGVALVIATPDQDRDRRRVIARQMTREEWLDSAGSAPEQAKGFVEVGCFADGTVQILSVPRESYFPVFKVDSEPLLRYLKRW